MKRTDISRLVFLALVFAVLSSHADYTLTVATADATKGAVTAVGGTYPEGTAVTITATPESGYTFTRWDGVVPSLRLDNPLVLPVTNDTAVTAVFGRTHYVATTGNDSTADGTDPSTPYKTIEKAYAAAADGDTVSVGPGTFVGTAAITLAKAVVIRGAGMDKTTRQKQSLTINNADAIVADIRLYGQTWGLMVSFPKNGAGGTLLRCDGKPPFSRPGPVENFPKTGKMISDISGNRPFFRNAPGFPAALFSPVTGTADEMTRRYSENAKNGTDV